MAAIISTYKNNTQYDTYQLYRTTPKLGGNMKIDLIVEKKDNRLYVRDAHIRPISDQSNYIPVVDERIMNNTHQFNISEFYKKTKYGFFEAQIDSALASDWPIPITITDLPNLKYLKTWDDTYCAGTRRMPYKLYGTTHECLVPTWLEKMQDVLTFKMIAWEPNGTSTGIDLILDKNEITGNKFHDDFVAYIFNYFEHVGLFDMNNDVINIDFKKNLASIKGIDVQSGNVTTVQLFNLTRNLLNRTRPLLETNCMITEQFELNTMITAQMFNFNICFNPEDICTLDYENTKYFKCQTYISETQDGITAISAKLGLRDLYTNHEFIPKNNSKDFKFTLGEDIYGYNEIIRKKLLDGAGHILNGVTFDKVPDNVLEFKQDYLSSELDHKNKIVQPTCHWCYVNNTSTLFNVYDGFGSWEISVDQATHNIKTPESKNEHLNIPPAQQSVSMLSGTPIPGSSVYKHGEDVSRYKTSLDKEDLVLYYTKTIVPIQDNTISSSSNEIIWKKYDESNEYVVRRSGKIKPAFFTPKLIRFRSSATGLIGKALHSNVEVKSPYMYMQGYGRNYMYEKTVLLPASAEHLDEFIANYVATGVAPKYKSVGYDSVYRSARHEGATLQTNSDGSTNWIWTTVPPADELTVEDSERTGYASATGQEWQTKLSETENLMAPAGDIMYNEPHPRFFGRTLLNEDIFAKIKNAQRNANKTGYFNFLKELGEETGSGFFASWEWPEFKWFDCSKVRYLPKELSYKVTVIDNSIFALNKCALNLIANIFDPNQGTFKQSIEKTYSDGITRNMSFYDHSYINSLYDFAYNLQNTNWVPKDGAGHYEYTYIINATLK